MYVTRKETLAIECPTCGERAKSMCIDMRQGGGVGHFKRIKNPHGSRVAAAVAAAEKRLKSLNELKESRDRTQQLIDDGKASGEFYNEIVSEYDSALEHLKEGTMTPEVFGSFKSRYRWEIYPILDVIWMCRNCKAHVPVETASPFRGAELCCSACDVTLTRRTGGGQGDPFNWTFKEKL